MTKKLSKVAKNQPKSAQKNQQMSAEQKRLKNAANKQLSKFKKLATDKEFTLEEKLKNGSHHIHIKRDNTKKLSKVAKNQPKSAQKNQQMSAEQNRLKNAANKQLSNFKKLATDKEFTLEEKLKNGSHHIHIKRDNKDGKKGKIIGCFSCEIVFEFSNAHLKRKKVQVPIKHFGDDDIISAIEETP